MRISDWSSDVCSSDLSGARGTKLRRRIPVRPLIASGKLASDGIIKLQIFDNARPVPVRVIFVLGSVIAIGGVIIRRRLARCDTADAQILARPGLDHRHALFCEAETRSEERSVGKEGA